MKPAARLLLLMSLIAAALLPTPARAAQPPYAIYLPMLLKPFDAVRLGPFVSPAVTGLAVSPVRSDAVYAGTYGGGIYKSVDGAANWVPISRGLPESASILSLVIDPSNPLRIYAGLYYNDNPGYASGVYRSEDGGLHWSPTGRMDNPEAGEYSNRVVVYALAISPDGNLLYAATRSKVPTPPFPYGCGGVFKSTDRGASWTLVNNGLPANDHYVYGLALDPDDPQRVYAGMHGSGVYRSLNAGAGWQAANSGLPPEVVNTTANRALVLDPAATARLIFGTTEKLTYGSLNSAASWTAQGLYNAYRFSLDLNREHAVYATDLAGSVYYSANFGQTWDKRAAQATDGFLAADPGIFGVVYAGGSNGPASLKKSVDSAETFVSRSHGISGYAVTGLAAHPATPGRLSVALLGWGVMLSTDGGQSWAQSNQGLPAGLALTGLAQDPNQPQVLVALTLSDGAYRSTNGGASWQALNTAYPAAGALDAASLPFRSPPDLAALDDRAGQAAPQSIGAGRVPGLSALVLPDSSLLLGTAGRGVWRWDGTAWAASSLGTGAVYALLLDSADAQRAWLGGEPAAGTLQVSADGGLTWNQSAAGLAGRTVTALAQSPQDVALLLAGTDDGVYVSRDSGQSWSFGGLGGQVVRAAAAHPQDARRLLAATDEAIYLSTDGGLTWGEIEPAHRAYAYLGARPVPDRPGYFYVYSRYGGVLLVKP